MYWPTCAKSPPRCTAGAAGGAAALTAAVGRRNDWPRSHAGLDELRVLLAARGWVCADATARLWW